MPLAGINASLQPDLFTGTLTGSIPIDVPPGRNGMQPNLALTYASSGGNGWIGMGWKLEMGAIERQARWGVLYQPTTAEEQTGKVYTIRLNGVSTDLVQDTADPLLYHEKVKGSFLRIKKLSTDGTAGWEITDTKGTKYKFGTGATTRVQGTVGSLGTQIFKWCLERVEDRDGNYMTVTYTGDQGQGYLSQIDYAGNGATAPMNQVKFWLEGRSDVSPMYLAGFLIQTAKRLKTVEILVNGTRTRAYSLSYEQVNAANPSRLIQVQGFGKDAVLDNQTKAVTGGAAFPPIQAKYAVFPYTNPGESTVQWTASANATDGSKAANYDYPGKFNLIGDFNGDGKKDVVAIPTGNTKFYVTLSTGSGWQVPNPGDGVRRFQMGQRGLMLIKDLIMLGT